MKTFTIAAILAVLATPALAQQTGVQQSQNESYSGAQSNVYMNNPDRIRSSLKTNPGIGGASLTTSNDTCAGSMTAGGSFVGFGGVIGKTYEMEHCVRSKETVLLAQLGNKGAATARLCQGKKVAQAMWDAGTPCPQDRQRYIAAQQAAAPRVAVATTPARRNRNAAPAPAPKANATAAEKRAAGLKYDPTVGRWR